MAITDFRKEYKWLSNFGYSPFKWFSVRRDEYLYFATVEHAYQSMKTFDIKEQDWVISSIGPRLARNRGQKVKLRNDWEEVKFMYMKNFIHEKFIQNKKLAKALIYTDDHFLVEENDWGDKYWGVYNGRGLNKLGFILMDLREILRSSNV